MKVLFLQELLSSVDNVRQKIVEPYNEIQTQCLILTRLHETSNILRCIMQIQQLAKNVAKHDMLKASAMIKEVGGFNSLTPHCKNKNLLIENLIPSSCSDEFCQDIDLSGIEVIETDKKIIKNERQRIWTSARSSLIEALDIENESQVCGDLR